MRALDGPAVLWIEVEAGFWIQNALAAILTAQPERAARHRRKDIPSVHGTDEECAAMPSLATGLAANVPGPLHAPHAHGIEVHRPVIRDDLEVRVVPLWWEEEGAVDQWVAVEHVHLDLAGHAMYGRHLEDRKTAKLFEKKGCDCTCKFTQLYQWVNARKTLEFRLPCDNPAIYNHFSC